MVSLLAIINQTQQSFRSARPDFIDIVLLKCGISGFSDLNIGLSDAIAFTATFATLLIAISVTISSLVMRSETIFNSEQRQPAAENTAKDHKTTTEENFVATTVTRLNLLLYSMLALSATITSLAILFGLSEAADNATRYFETTSAQTPSVSEICISSAAGPKGPTAWLAILQNLGHPRSALFIIFAAIVAFFVSANNPFEIRSTLLDKYKPIKEREAATRLQRVLDVNDLPLIVNETHRQYLPIISFLAYSIFTASITLATIALSISRRMVQYNESLREAIPAFSLSQLIFLFSFVGLIGYVTRTIWCGSRKIATVSQGYATTIIVAFLVMATILFYIDDPSSLEAMSFLVGTPFTIWLSLYFFHRRRPDEYRTVTRWLQLFRPGLYSIQRTVEDLSNESKTDEDTISIEEG